MTPSVPASPDVLHRVDLEVAAHDSRIHDLELTVFQLTQQVEILTAQANAKPATNHQRATRQELKAHGLAFEILRREGILAEQRHPETPFSEAVRLALQKAPTFGDDAEWKFLTDVINIGRPDPFRKPSDDTKALVIRILERF